MVPRKRTPFIVKKLVQILEDDIAVCMKEWPIYFQLRACLEVNAFPFDVDYLSLDEFNEDSQKALLGPAMTANGQHLLPADFQFIKINSFYTLRVELRHLSLVNAVKLVFNSDMKSIHKIKVTILVHKESQRKAKSLFEQEPSAERKDSAKAHIVIVKTFDQCIF